MIVEPIAGGDFHYLSVKPDPTLNVIPSLFLTNRAPSFPLSQFLPGICSMTSASAS